MSGGGGDEESEGQVSAETERAAHTTKEAAEGLGENIVGLIDDSDPDDHTKEDVEAVFETAGEVAGAAEEGAKAWGETEDAVRAAQSGDTAGVVDGIGGAASGTAGALADNLGAVGHLTHDEGFQDAARVARIAQSGLDMARRVTDQVFDAIERIEDASHERSRHVEYELTTEDADGWKVDVLTATEALNEPYELVLEVHHEDEDADARELIGRNAELLIDRREHNRRFCGVIRRVEEASHRRHRVNARLHVVPALWALGRGQNSRIFQDKTVVQILESVLTDGLQPHRREVDVSLLEESYPEREYCVQYRESDLAFCHRLMEEEGIGYHFEFDGDGWEKLVLFERNGQLAEAPTLDGRAVPFVERADVIRRAEPIVELRPARQLTATQVDVCDYDWTQSSTRLEGTGGGPDERGQSRIRYEHGHGQSATLFEYSEGNGRYAQNDVERRAMIRFESHAQQVDTLSGTSLVTGFAPGRTFQVTGHPTPGIDGAYLVTRVVHRTGAPDAEEGASGTDDYHNTFECISLEVPYRPLARAAKPSIYGVQTAKVIGGNDGEIVTDAYGRIRVKFHWDRLGTGDRTSCWIRVAQVWAGHDGMGHPGFLFIPRVAMEVVVTFVDGDPDRPLVTGSVYNGTNLPPVALPDEASRSVIRTRSLGGTGYNELSFEDASGSEEVHLRAERNLRELVQNDHGTRVGHDQRLDVDNDQRTRVGGVQELHVEGAHREVIVDHEERHNVTENRSLEVGGLHEVTVHGEQHVEVDQNELHTVHGARELTVDQSVTYQVGQGIDQTIDAGGWRTATTGNSDHNVAGQYVLHADADISITTDAGATVMATGPIDMTAQAINMTATTAVNVRAPAGIKHLTPATHEHTAVYQYHQVQDWLESISGKLGSYTTAIGIYGMKVGIAGLKIDMYDSKISNGTIKLGTGGTKLDNLTGGHVKRALVTIFG